MINIKERVLEEAENILKTKKTIRELANEMNFSKSTIHNDLTTRLFKINKDLYFKVKSVLEYHKSIRHINGGLATKNRYEKLKNKNHC